VLAGQRLSYLREQTQAYLAKRRKYLDSMKESAFTGKSLEINGTAVREAIGALGQEDAESLAHFFSSIRPAAATGRRRR
jgi:cytochrome c553